MYIRVDVAAERGLVGPARAVDLERQNRRRVSRAHSQTDSAAPPEKQNRLLGSLPLAIHLAVGRPARGLRIESLLKDIKGWVLDRKAVDSGEHCRQLLAASILASLRALEQAVAGDGDPALSIAQVAPALSGFAAGPASGVGDSTSGYPSRPARFPFWSADCCARSR